MTDDDGGPAFPVPYTLVNNENLIGGLSDQNNFIGGMSLRDYFAAKAMQSLILIGAKRIVSVDRDEDVPNAPLYFGEFLDVDEPNNLAEDAYCIADTMLIQREVKD